MEIARVRIINMENLLVKYFEYKKDDKKFKKHLDKEAKRLTKDRANNDVLNDKQPEVSKSKWCTKMRTGIRKKKTINKKKEEIDNENIWDVIKNTIWKWVGIIL